MAQTSGSRRRARESAMQILCLIDRQPELSAAQAASMYFAHLLGDDGEASTIIEALNLPSESRLFVESLVSGVRRA